MSERDLLSEDHQVAGLRRRRFAPSPLYRPKFRAGRASAGPGLTVLA
jgi:hypothetical protein